jgi:hypothetical protein
MADKRKTPTDEEMKARALSRWENEGGAPAPQPRKRLRDPKQPAKRAAVTGESGNAKRSVGVRKDEP